MKKSQQNNTLVDQEYLDYLKKYADGFYDAGDIAECKRAIAAGELKKAVPVLKEDYF